MNEWEMIVAVLGLVVLSAVTRSFFFLSERPMALPGWAERGLKYAPLAALAAVVLPELVMSRGELPRSWHDARFFAGPVAVAWALWRKDMLTTIAVGMVVYLGIRMVLGW